VLVYCGTVVTEVLDALARYKNKDKIAVLAVTSPDMLYRGFNSDGDASHVSQLLAGVKKDARIVTVHDAHPASLSWIGSVRGHRVTSLGVSAFGQSGDCIDLFKEYEMDGDAILRALNK
jgi:pyruvate dehydrogenase E1 component